MTNPNLAYRQALARLNPEQKLAADTLDGPLLVLAGPGTGKTQLLSVRVANILSQTDASPSNILCLTFTESGAANMRTRLREIIGEAAYDVTISTYHSFGSDIIKNYGEYFQQLSVDRQDDVRLEHPIDELLQIREVERLISLLPFDCPLLSARYYVKDVVKTISDLKQHLYSPTKLRELGRSNLSQIDQAQGVLDTVINQVGGVSSRKTQLFQQYASLHAGLAELKGSLVEIAANELAAALELAADLNSSKPLTVWKNKFLYKNDQDRFTLTKRSTSEKILELSTLYEAYEQTLKKGALYDFDDMILRTIDAISHNSELRFNLQERYQYLLLDEFQDTNPAQFELVKKIALHPVHEGRPNVMAVGDDDQAIFAFQGASLGNIQDFLESFRDVVVLNLVRNYRSHQDILHVAQNIRAQITAPLNFQAKGIDKVLLVGSQSLPAKASIRRHIATSPASEYAWVAQQIAQLLSQGVDPQNIAVLAPKHRFLENLVPFLNQEGIPLAYEKRENLLNTEIIQSLRLSASLLLALNAQNQTLANQYFPQVLSLPFWGHNPLEIWQTNWQLSDSTEPRNWSKLSLTNPSLAEATNFYLALSQTITTQPLEHILDQLLGTKEVTVGDKKLFSPLKNYYFSKANRTIDALQYYEALSHLSVIRTRLRDYQRGSSAPLTLTDFLDLFTMYEAAGVGLLNDNPITQAPSSVRLLTAYKAKGLEFDHVFLLHAQDEVWGSRSRGGENKLSLPLNLSHIRYRQSSDDERLRLLFVAITRARHGLYLTSHERLGNGELTTPLKYLGETGGISPHLPDSANQIETIATTPAAQAVSVATLWSAGRVSLPVDFRSLLAEHLERYLMSPTHLNTFLDLEHGGPEAFLTKTLLRFPSAPEPSSEYGQAIHNTLEWYQLKLSRGETPKLSTVLAHFDEDLKRRYLFAEDLSRASSKGRAALKNYLKSRAEMFAKPAKVEVNFFGEGVVVDGARLTGKIDRLEVDQASKTLRIIDFKTGHPLTKWDSTLRSYKYRHQLYFYKLLIESSHTWREFSVSEARLEFVEPSDPKTGVILPPLSIQFSDEEAAEFKRLLKVVWDKIQRLDLPATDQYSKNLQGTKAFIRDLLS